MVALCVIAIDWKQPKCPSTGDWMNFWYIHRVEYYSLIKRSELLIHIITLMNLKINLLSEKSQAKRVHTHLCRILENANLSIVIERSSIFA